MDSSGAAEAWLPKHKISKVHVVTVCTRAEGCTTALLYSDAILNTNLRLLGWGESYGGAGWRLKKVVDYCKEVEPDDVVVVVDGFNSVVLQPREVILEKFLEFGGRVVCMAQRGALLRHSRPLLSPGHVESAAAQTSRAQLTVLNASAFAGYARDIIQLFADAPEHISHHELLGDLYQRHPDGRVTIDANCSLFHRYRSAGDLAIVSYADAHAKSLHVPPQFPSAADAVILPSTASNSPPFFRPSALPRIAMDSVTRETPCFLHIPRSRSADASLQKLGLPTQRIRPGGFAVVPLCCQRLIHKYQHTVLPGNTRLHRPVSWMFTTFFVSVKILGILGVRSVLNSVLDVVPREASEPFNDSFFAWGGGQQQEPVPQDLHQVTKTAALAATSALCDALHQTFNFFDAFSCLWMLCSAMSGVGLLAVALWTHRFSLEDGARWAQSPGSDRFRYSGGNQNLWGAHPPEENGRELGTARGEALERQLAHASEYLARMHANDALDDSIIVPNSFSADGNGRKGETPVGNGRPKHTRRAPQRAPSAQKRGARRRRASLKRQASFLTDASNSVSSGSYLDDSASEVSAKMRTKSERPSSRASPMSTNAGKTPATPARIAH